jgi:hypothetical protein
MLVCVTTALNALMQEVQRPTCGFTSALCTIKKQPEDGKITIDNGTMIYNGTCGGPYTVEYEACADNTVCQIVRRKFSAPCTVTEYPVVLDGMD